MASTGAHAPGIRRAQPPRPFGERLSNPEETSAPAPSSPEGATEGTLAEATTPDAGSELPLAGTAEPNAPSETAAAPVARSPRGADYVSDRAFADFPISSEVLAGLQGLGYTMSTPVQAMMIDPALAGKDLLVRAKTGTGKTCAFCVPVVERIQAGDRKVRALVLAPTRELAIQVAQECTAIGAFLDVRIAVIYGGVGFGPQEQALKDGCEIVVGTPGRVLDHVKRGNLVLSELQFAVLDEADEMLSMGFLEDGHAERAGLAGTGLGPHEQVLAGKGGVDRHRLNRRGVAVAEGREPAEQRGGDREVREGAVAHPLRDAAGGRLLGGLGCRGRLDGGGRGVGGRGRVDGGLGRIGQGIYSGRLPRFARGFVWGACPGGRAFWNPARRSRA